MIDMQNMEHLGNDFQAEEHCTGEVGVASSARDVAVARMTQTFRRNLLVLKESAPPLYDFFVNYQPNEMSIYCDEEGVPNVVANGSKVYIGDPRDFSKVQVEHYWTAPSKINYERLKADWLKFQHAIDLDAISERSASDPIDFLESANAETRMDSLLVVGVGLGFHIQELFAKKKVKHCLLYEPQADFFFASLFTVDYFQLMIACEREGGKLRFQIGGEQLAFKESVSEMVEEIGHFHLARMFIYKHYANEATDTAIKSLMPLIESLVSMWGFFEDEAMGLKHTVKSIRQGQRFIDTCASGNNFLAEHPFFVVGNGPSLDKNIEYLRNIQDEAIVVSCGSALHTLLSSGIKPDFHVEVERTTGIDQAHELAAQMEGFRDVHLIGLNTLHESTLDCFSEKSLYLKAFDLGALFIEGLNSDRHFRQTRFCNPTVANGALAFAHLMGFRDIALFGVDCGYADETRHHASASSYFDQEWSLYEHHNQRMSLRHREAASIVPGNFGGQVWTNRNYNETRHALEKQVSTWPEDTKLYNCSAGAKIDGYKPASSQDLLTRGPIQNKKEAVTKLMSTVSTPLDAKSSCAQDMLEKLCSELDVYVSELIKIAQGDGLTRESVSDLFEKQRYRLSDLKHRGATGMPYVLLQGTLKYFQTEVMMATYRFSPGEEQTLFLKWAVGLMNGHLRCLLHDFRLEFKN
jgi:hypothetical protein